MTTTTPTRGAATPKRMLVAVERGTSTDNALHAAVELGRAFGATFEVVHALQTHGLGADYVDAAADIARGSDLASVLERELGAHVRDVVASCGASDADKVVTRVVPGPAARVVVTRAREMEAELLVLEGVRQRSFTDFGSVARGILGRAKCPVLVQISPPAPIRSIFVAVDLSSESLIALRTACAWAAKLEARVIAFHCFDALPATARASWYSMVPDNIVAILRDEERRRFDGAMRDFDWGGVPHETHFSDGDPGQQILAHSHHADLIVMGSHGRTGFTAALLGSVVHRVLRDAEVPVLVVRDNERVFES